MVIVVPRRMSLRKSSPCSQKKPPRYRMCSFLAGSPYGHIMPSSFQFTMAITGWQTIPIEKREEFANTFISGKETAGRKIGIRQIAAQWAEKDPVDALAWLDGLPESDATAKYGTIASVISPKDLPGALSRLKEQPPEAYRISIIQVFDAWQKAHPGEKPEHSTLDAFTLRVWEDLQSLSP